MATKPPPPSTRGPPRPDADHCYNVTAREVCETGCIASSRGVPLPFRGDLIGSLAGSANGAHGDFTVRALWRTDAETQQTRCKEQAFSSTLETLIQEGRDGVTGSGIQGVDTRGGGVRLAPLGRRTARRSARRSGSRRGTGAAHGLPLPEPIPARRRVRNLICISGSVPFPPYFYCFILPVRLDAG